MNMFKTLEAKTPEEYIEKLEEPRKSEMKVLFDLIKKTIPQYPPEIGYGMIGFRKFHYKTKSGQEGDWHLIGLASQKNYISIYVCASDGTQYVAEKHKEQLPKASIGRSCIRIKHTKEIDLDILKKVILEGVAQFDKNGGKM